MATATATFNTKIETSNVNGEYNTYYLPNIITTSGFNTENLSYELTGKMPPDISIDTNDLLVGFNSVGPLQILVYDNKTEVSAIATTTVSPSFNKLVSDLKSSVTEQYNKIKSSWPFNQQELPA